MIKENFKRKLWISFGIIVGSVIIATAALYIFSGDLTAQANSIASDRALVEKQTENVANLASLEANASEAAVYQSAIDKLLPSQYGLVNFGEWLDQRGQAYGVSPSFSFQGNPPANSPGTLGQAAFSVTAQGPSVSSLRDFLKDIEIQAPGFLLSFNSFNVTNNGPTATLTAQGVLFFQ